VVNFSIWLKFGMSVLYEPRDEATVYLSQRRRCAFASSSKTDAHVEVECEAITSRTLLSDVVENAGKVMLNG